MIKDLKIESLVYVNSNSRAILALTLLIIEISTKKWILSIFKLEEITEKIKRFVPNPSLDKAHKILEKENCVVISGAPGVGKTTLAEMLIWEFVIKGYEFVNISENIREAFSLYSLDPNRKQIFYYDDFLGTTNLTKNEDSSLILFISKINKSQNKKMILTTREYILQQKRILYEKINNFDFKKCIIDLKNYTKRIKAEILYSHLYFSELPYEYILALIDNEHYLEDAKDKLEEINDKLELLNDLDEIDDRIAELYEIEENLSEYQREENRAYGHSYKNNLLNIEQEENNIKNLFNSLDKK